MALNPHSLPLPDLGSLPEPLRGLEEGTFTEHSLTWRMPEIGRRTLAENDFLPAMATRFQALIDDLPHGRIRPLLDDQAPDSAAWAEYTAPYLGQTWLESPWFFAETYDYRRILEATGYFIPGPTQRLDPYRRQKRQGLEHSQEAIRLACEQVNAWLAELRPCHQHLYEQMEILLKMNLWGNQADLSIWPAGQAARPDHSAASCREAYLLQDDTAFLLADLCAGQGDRRRMDVLLDNAGLELVYDLLLADACLSRGLASQVVLHSKFHPTFVSDVIAADIDHTLAFLKAASQAEARAAARWAAHLAQGRLLVQDHLFWTSPLAFWELLGDLAAELRSSSLIISKGDANYRRLLGDRHWPFEAPFQEVLRYAPAPLLALRVSKSEVMVGQSPERVAYVTAQDPHWMTDGRWGVIRYSP